MAKETTHRCRKAVTIPLVDAKILRTKTEPCVGCGEEITLYEFEGLAGWWTGHYCQAYARYLIDLARKESET